MVCVLLIAVMLLPLGAGAAIKNVGFEDYYSQLGVDTSFNLKKVEAGQTVEGVVKNAEVLKKLVAQLVLKWVIL